MLPDRYFGIWRRDWIERHHADTGVVLRDDSPAIWFQSPCLHVDLRIDRALREQTSTNIALPRTQIAFAGRTEVRVQGAAELCQWHPAFAYPRIVVRVHGISDTDPFDRTRYRRQLRGILAPHQRRR